LAEPAKAAARAALLARVPVFGLLKRNGGVYVAIFPNVSSVTPFPIIRDKIRPDSIVCTDSFRSHDALDVSEFQHVRINHSELFADQTNHINGIEHF
jgi:transposase